MKSTIMHLLSLFLILGFAAACGKKSSDGGSSNSSSPLVNSNISQTGAAAYNAVKAWYDSSAAENVTIGSNGSFLKKTSSVGGFSGSLNLCAPLFGITSGCVVPTGCYVNNNVTGLYLGTPTVNSSSVYTGCNILGAVIYKKSNNVSLKEAISGRSGLSLLNATQSGSLFTLEYGTLGSLTPSLVFQINTSIHSMFNPTYIKEGSQETKFLGFKIHQQ